MSRYDGLIIPRSYSEYINKTDAATLLQALQLSGVMDNAPTANSNNPVKSGGVKAALNEKNALIKYKDVTIESLQIGGYGYTNIQDKKPSGMNNLLFVLVMGYGNSSLHQSFDVNAFGDYMRGAAGDEITTIRLRYFYTD